MRFFISHITANHVRSDFRDFSPLHLTLMSSQTCYCIVFLCLGQIFLSSLHFNQGYNYLHQIYARVPIRLVCHIGHVVGFLLWPSEKIKFSSCFCAYISKLQPSRYFWTLRIYFTLLPSQQYIGVFVQIRKTFHFFPDW